MSLSRMRVKEVVSISDYAMSFVESDWFAQYCDEAYWADNFNSNYLYDVMMDWAAQDGVEIEDEDNFDFSEFVYESYKDTEKGLS